MLNSNWGRARGMPAERLRLVGNQEPEESRAKPGDRIAARGVVDPERVEPGRLGRGRDAPDRLGSEGARDAHRDHSPPPARAVADVCVHACSIPRSV